MSEKNKTPDNYKEALSYFASLGGKAVSKKYGKAYYSKIGKIGMAKRWGSHINKQLQKGGKGAEKQALSKKPIEN